MCIIASCVLCTEKRNLLSQITSYFNRIANFQALDGVLPWKIIVVTFTNPVTSSNCTTSAKNSLFHWLINGNRKVCFAWKLMYYASRKKIIIIAYGKRLHITDTLYVKILLIHYAIHWNCIIFLFIIFAFDNCSNFASMVCWMGWFNKIIESSNSQID